jgi:hypothetical protein
MGMAVLQILRRTLEQLDREASRAHSSGDRFAFNTATAAKVRVRRILDRLDQIQNGSTPAKSPRKKPKSPEPVESSKYPRFEVRQGALVRIGWSKKYERQYVHRVSAEAFKATLSALEGWAEVARGAVLPEQIALRIRQGHNDQVSLREIYATLNMLLEAGAISHDDHGGLYIPQNVIAITKRTLGKTG